LKNNFHHPSLNLLSAFFSLEKHKFNFCKDCISVEISKHNILSLTFRKNKTIQFDEIASIVKKYQTISLYRKPDRFIRIKFKTSGSIDICESDSFAIGEKNINYDLFIDRISEYWVKHNILVGKDYSEEEDAFFEQGNELFIDEEGNFMNANGDYIDEQNYREPFDEEDKSYEIPKDNSNTAGSILWALFCLFVALFWAFRLVDYGSVFLETGKIESQVGVGIFVFILFGGEAYRQFFGRH